MIPDELKIKVHENVIYWTNGKIELSERQAREVSERIKTLAVTGCYKALVVDNRFIHGEWSPDVDRVWVELLKFIPQYVDKTVTICDTVINKVQLNYLSQQAGTHDRVQAFVHNEHKALEDFMQPYALQMNPENVSTP